MAQANAFIVASGSAFDASFNMLRIMLSTGWFGNKISKWINGIKKLKGVA